MLVSLWGGLGQKNTITMHVSESDNTAQVIEEDRTILSIRPTNDEDTLVEYVKNNDYYVTNHARVACFVLADGRFLMSSTMKPYVNDIVRCFTDGLLATKELPFETGNELGRIKYEGKAEHITIVNVRKTWDDKKDFKL
jgi:hypothetical protein